jgi:hypothetical protein
MPIVIANPVQPLIFTDDFESYTTSATISSQNSDYTPENFNGGGNWISQTSITNGGDKVGRVNVSGNTRTMLTYNPWTFTDGRVRARIVHRSDGIADAFTRPGLICRKTNSTNYLAAYMANDTNLLTIQDYNGTVTTATASFSPSLDTNYWFELVFNGASATATVYSDSGYNTVLATVSKTVNKTGSGQAGLYAANDSSAAEHDDLEIVNNG